MRIRIFLLLLMPLASLQAGQPAELVDTGYLGNAEYSAVFKQHKAAGRFSSVLIGRVIQGQRYYRGLFGPRPRGDFSYRALRKMSPESFRNADQKYLKRGFRLLWKQSFRTEKAGLSIQAVWVAGNNEISDCLQAGRHWYYGACQDSPIGLLAQQPSVPALAGWTRDLLAHHGSSCADTLYRPALSEYQARVKAAGNDPNQHLDKLRRMIYPPMLSLCDCVFARISSQHTLAEFSADMQAISERETQQALAGKACAPGGLMGNVLRR